MQRAERARGAAGGAAEDAAEVGEGPALMDGRKAQGALHRECHVPLAVPRVRLSLI